MVPPPSGELDIDALLETARKDPAYRDLSTEELFLQVTQKLYSALKADKERAASGETQPAESNKVLQAKEWIYPDCYEAYICRYKGKNYYADILKDQNKFCQPISLKVGTNREAALVKARELYRERGSLQARGIFSKSITTKELFDLYAKDQSYRIHKETKTGLIQISYDAKLKRLGTGYGSSNHLDTRAERLNRFRHLLAGNSKTGSTSNQRNDTKTDQETSKRSTRLLVPLNRCTSLL